MSTDIHEVLLSAIQATGRVTLAYGGFRVDVTEPSKFPWERVFRLLLALHHDVWVIKKGDTLVIQSKPTPI